MKQPFYVCEDRPPFAWSRVDAFAASDAARRFGAEWQLRTYGQAGATALLTVLVHQSHIAPNTAPTSAQRILVTYTCDALPKCPGGQLPQE